MKLLCKLSTAVDMAKARVSSFVENRKNDRNVLTDDKGETYIGEVVKILIAVVVGALVLALVYALLKDTVFPEIQEKIMGLFDYDGTT